MTYMTLSVTNRLHISQLACPTNKKQTWGLSGKTSTFLTLQKARQLVWSIAKASSKEPAQVPLSITWPCTFNGPSMTWSPTNLTLPIMIVITAYKMIMIYKCAGQHGCHCQKKEVKRPLTVQCNTSIYGAVLAV